MEQTVNQRVKAYIDNKKISQESFRASIGVANKQQVSQWLTESSRIPEKYLIEMIRKYVDVNARWLLTGEGEMFLNPANETLQLNDIKTIADCENCKRLNSYIERQERLIERLERQLGHDVPDKKVI